MATTGLKGNLLPESEADFADNYDAMRYKTCLQCQKGFTSQNTKSVQGWRETQITGMCERDFDALFNGDNGCPNDD